MSTLSATDGTIQGSTLDSIAESSTKTLREENYIFGKLVDIDDNADRESLGERYVDKEKGVEDINIYDTDTQDLSAEEPNMEKNESIDIESNDENPDYYYGESSTSYTYPRRSSRKTGLFSGFYPLSDRNAYNFSADLIAQFDRYRMTMHESLRQELEELERTRQNPSLQKTPASPTSETFETPVRSPSPTRTSVSTTARPISTDTNAPMKCFSSKQKYRKKGRRRGNSGDKLDDWIITKGREEISEEMSVDEDGTITEDVNISNNSALEGKKRSEGKSDDGDSDTTEKRKTARMKREQSLRRVGSTRRKFGLFDKCMSLDDE
ncbi:4503_t:CDS:2 [Paraglomus occultum]|uniref:4503_t:CDS:1 n=1 Tax=Paraglomus occultum TaxID=144539 RepID=A0A9N9F702_9GLOM|nr:4503_t:CDS:2 [Paraglomus occultum]